MRLILRSFCSICGSRVTPTYKYYSDILDRLWWLNLFVYLTKLKDAQIGGETLLLSVFLRVFLEDTNIWFSKVSRDLPWQMCVGIIQCNEGLNTTHKWKKGKSFSFWTGTSLFFCPQTSELLLLEPLNLESMPAPPWFSDFWSQSEFHHQVS